MERVRIGKDIVFQWEVRKDGAALTAEDAANLTLEIAGRNGKSQRLPFEIRDSKIIAAWYGVKQTEIGAYRLTCWHNRGKVGESVVDVVWAVELVQYTTEETFDDIETVTIELDGGNLAFAALKGASAYEVAVAEGFVGTEAEWVASLKKPAEDAAEDAEEAAQRAINAAVEATESAENAQTEAGNARAAGDYAYEMAIAAERVNAQLNGNVLTVTNRQGVSESVNTKGEQGEQGNPGQAATISVGTTATGAPGTNAQVTNSGTSSAAVLDFTIPQGAKGDKGDQGEPGEVTEAELTEKLAAKANTDGYYSRMIVGGSESLIGDVPQTVTYTFRRTGGGAIGEPVARLTEIQGNTGVVNQLASFTSESKTQNGITYSLQANGKVKVSGTASAAVASLSIQDNPLIGITSHKYFLKTPKTADEHFYIHWLGLGIYSPGGTDIYTCTTPGTYGGVYVRCSANAVVDYEDYIIAIDLTLMYGSGNEPGTVAEFEARIWRDYGKTLDEYIAYTPGKLINCKALALENVGQNQWDEEWEIGAIETHAPGNPITDSGCIRSKNFIPVVDALYYFAKGSTSLRFIFYDTNKNFVSSPPSSITTNAAFSLPTGAAFVKFYTRVTPTTYNNDICINISDAAINGTYRPYKKDVMNLNLTTLTGINPTTGVREVMFPNGMRSKGDVRDVISGNTATVRIGDPTQEAPLENTVLATPIVYTDLQYSDGTPFVLPRNYEVQNDGTEKITHTDGEDSIAPVMSTIYGLNAVGFVQDAPKDYTSQATLDALLSALSSVTGHTFTKTWDAANNKWVFS